MTNIGDVQQVRIEHEMRDAYLDYAMSVIVARALPDARDGLKPVHRRILYAMYDMGLRADTPYKKSARIVGEVLGKYHPHGDVAVYETMVRLAQDFSMRYMLVDGQGNFGSIDGDSAAAMRYTEARMAEIGEEMLVDIDKATVDFTDNFDGSLQEPLVLPSSFPNLLVNGSSGIAVGMSTNVPPHNLNEVCDALIYMLRQWNTLEDITVTDLMKFVKGPDFPTGGLVYRHQDGQEGEDTLVTAYATGQGKITVRAKAHIEDMGRGKARIIVTELPYQVNKSTLIERIASVVRDGKVEGIADLRDESDRQGMRLVIELQRGAEAPPVLAALYKLTPLQETFSIRTLALVDSQPRLLSLKQALRVYLDHRLEIVRRRSEYDMARAKERAHILEGLLKALDNLDEAIRLIRASQTADIARERLMQSFELSELQAQAILDMQLRRLAALERKKIQDEYDEKLKLIEYLEGLLQSPEKMRSVIAEELGVIKSAYADKRRTVIVDGTASSARVEDLLMPEEKTWVTLTTNGRLARTLTNEAPRVAASTKEPPRFMAEATTAQILYLISEKGRCATVPVQLLPQVEDPAEGAGFHELSPLASSEKIASLLSLPAGLETGYLFLTTETGQVKRLRLEDLPGMTSNVFSVMNVGGDDRLICAFTTDGRAEVLLTTDQAQAIRFKENEVRPTGLPAGGMRGIKLASEKDKVVAANIVNDGQYVWSITNDGIAKVSPIEEYPTQGRAGGGVITMRLPKTSRSVVANAVGELDDVVVILSNKDKAKPTKMSAAPVIKRGRAGGAEVFKPTRQNEVVQSVMQIQTIYTPPEAGIEEVVVAGEIEPEAS
ncbi:MAG: DNA gyrase subunit A [bacterium]|nr:DNA gyrase subunit A [bacterium]